MSLVDLADRHTALFLRYEKSIRSYLTLKAKDRTFDCGEKPLIFILTGAPGCGKTCLARECFPSAYWLSKPNGNQQLWFDGYRGQEVLIVDEFYSWIPYDLLCRLWDYYALWLPYKGGSAKCGFKIFVFTSNESVVHWYPKVENKGAFWRRITEFALVHEWNNDKKQFERIKY